MINEYIELHTSMQNAKINTDIWHREYKPLPKATANAPCICILLLDTGAIYNIYELNVETARTIRKYGNNQASFPAFNIKPLYRLTDQNQIKLLKKIKDNNTLFNSDDVKNWITDSNWHKSMKKIDNSIRDASGRMMDVIEQSGIVNLPTLTRLIRACKNMSCGLHNAITDYILRQIESRVDINMLLHILIHSGDADKKAMDDMGNNISIVLDIADISNDQYPVASEHVTRLFNKALLQADEKKANEAHVDSRDAFDSPFDINIQEPMPSVNLPGFDIKLRAMFHEQHCQFRYKKIDDASYPISKPNRYAAKQAIEWIAQKENEGITWTRADRNEIVFVYPSKLLSGDPRIASIFNRSPGAESKRAQARFAEYARDFIKVYKGKNPINNPEFIRIFAIRKMDRSKSKIMLTRTVSPEQLILGADNWVIGCKNIPIVPFTKPYIPYPLEIASIVNNVWKRDGKMVAGGKANHRMKYYEGLELLINPLYDNNVNFILHSFLENSEGLIHYLGNYYHRGSEVLNYYSEYIAGAIAVLGLLLFKCHIVKEIYMENISFLLGQFLHACDEIHSFYCKVERNGDIPRQLAGNAILPMATDMPEKALAHLSVRMNPYLSWAKQYSIGKKQVNDIPNNLVGWHIGVLEHLSDKMHLKLDDSINFGDYDKAQLFLGYLASLPQFKKNSMEK